MEFPLPTVFNEVPTKAYMRELGIYQFRKIALRVSRNIYIRCRLAEAQNWRCCWCGVECVEEPGYSNSATIEHLQPRSLGGCNHTVEEDPYENYAMACLKCNNRRGTLSIEDFLAGRIPAKQPTKQESKAERQLAKRMRKYRRHIERFNSYGWVRNDRAYCPFEWLDTLRVPAENIAELRTLIEA